MNKSSFIAGLVAGSGAAILAVISVPSLVPARGDNEAPQRAPVTKVIVVPEEPRTMAAPAPEPPAASRAENAPQAKAREATANEANEKALRRASNETAVIATLRNIVSAQAQFQCTARADEDKDGVGEYGSFGELSGAIGVRDGQALNPPVLSTAFRKVENGRVERNGYLFQIYLPQAGGQPVPERDGGGFGAGETDADLAETCWCVYAWPVEGEGRTFFINQAGDVLENSDAGYAGDRSPPAYAAFRNASGLTAPAAIGTRGADRCEWKQVG